MLSRPIKGPAVENIALNMDVYGETNIMTSHNLALITIYITPEFFI